MLHSSWTLGTSDEPRRQIRERYLAGELTPDEATRRLLELDRLARADNPRRAGSGLAATRRQHLA